MMNVLEVVELGCVSSWQSQRRLRLMNARVRFAEAVI